MVLGDRITHRLTASDWLTGLGEGCSNGIFSMPDFGKRILSFDQGCTVLGSVVVVGKFCSFFFALSLGIVGWYFIESYLCLVLKVNC